VSRRRVLPAVLLAALLAGAAAGVHRPAPAPRVLPTLTLHVGALDRSFLVYAPAGLGRGAPLVILLHGSGGAGASMRYSTGYEFEELAERERFVVAYPDGYRGNWNDCRKKASYPARAENIDDGGFLRALVERLVKDAGVDPSRVFVAGYSNGAQLAFRLALEAPERFAGIAGVAAGLPTTDNTVCRAANRPIPALLINGTADPLNPFDGGEVLGRGTVLSTKETGAYFAGLNGQGAPTRATLPHREAGDPTLVERTDWASPGHAEVVLDVVRGGGHLVPQTRTPMPARLGRMTGDLDGPAEIWSFFSRQPPRPRP
jgi:polyhydroxybutyrate depolymerase